MAHTCGNDTRVQMAAMAVLAVAWAGLTASAASVSWDPGITGAATGGGTTSEATEWKTSGAGTVWYDSTIPGNVVWTNGNNAAFSGTAGTVNLGSAVSAGTLSFGTTGYTVDLRDYNAGSATGAAAYALTLTGLSGSAATIRNTSSTTAATVTLSMATDTVWAGNIGSTAERLGITVNGGNDLTVNQLIRAGGAGQTTLTISGAGTKLALSGTGSNFDGNFVTISGGATFDLGANGTFRGRQINLDATSTITATGTARIHDNSNLNASIVTGLLTGTLAVESSDPNPMTLSNNNNSYSGGTILSTWGNASTGSSGSINADANNALGTGPVEFTNTSNIPSILSFRSAASVIGSLASSGAGAKSVVLGNTGIDTTLTVGALGTNTSFGGVISEFAGRVGSLKKVGGGTLTLSGPNTYTGATTIDAGKILLSSSGSIAPSSLIDLGPGGTLDVKSQSFAMSGSQSFKFRIDPAGAGVAGLLDATTLNISAGVVDFATLGTLDDAAYVIANYTSKSGTAFASISNLPAGYSIDYAFNGGTQIALVVPEPASLGLLTVAGLVIRRRRA